jgi:hypothetical protein
MGINSITNFKTGFNGGTRANRFKVQCEFPSGTNGSNTDMEFKVSATSMPIAQVGSVLVPYRGRPVIYAGDRQYSPWTVTVYDDGHENHLWQVFNQWMEDIDGHFTHEYTTNDFTYSAHQKNMFLYQYDANGNTIRTVTLVNAFPISVYQIDLNMGSVDPVQFVVQLMFDKFVIS